MTNEEAIEKRSTPQMVEYEKVYENNGVRDCLIFQCAYCPNCGHDFYSNEAAVWRMPYCPNCGQALRWEDDEGGAE